MRLQGNVSKGMTTVPLPYDNKPMTCSLPVVVIRRIKGGGDDVHCRPDYRRPTHDDKWTQTELLTLRRDASHQKYKLFPICIFLFLIRSVGKQPFHTCKFCLNHHRYISFLCRWSCSAWKPRKDPRGCHFTSSASDWDPSTQQSRVLLLLRLWW